MSNNSIDANVRQCYLSKAMPDRNVAYVKAYFGTVASENDLAVVGAISSGPNQRSNSHYRPWTSPSLRRLVLRHRLRIFQVYRSAPLSLLMRTSLP